jgi:hypothetical protein
MLGRQHHFARDLKLESRSIQIARNHETDLVLSPVQIARNHGQMSNVPVHQELRTIGRRGRNSLHGNEFKNFEFSAKRRDCDLSQSETGTALRVQGYKFQGQVCDSRQMMNKSAVNRFCF